MTVRGDAEQQACSQQNALLTAQEAHELFPAVGPNDQPQLLSYFEAAAICSQVLRDCCYSLI